MNRPLAYVQYLRLDATIGPPNPKNSGTDASSARSPPTPQLQHARAQSPNPIYNPCRATWLGPAGVGTILDSEAEMRECR